MNTLPETHRRPLFPRGPGLGLRTFLLALISLALIFNDSRGDGLERHRLRARLDQQRARRLDRGTAALRGGQALPY